MHLEVTARRERRIQRRIKDARFPMLKTLDAFWFQAQPDRDRDAVLQVCQRDYRVRFVTAAELVTMLVEAQQQGRMTRKLPQLARFDVVDVDELGTSRSTRPGPTCCSGSSSQRYERRSLVVTTNLPFARWSEVFLGPDGGRRGHRPDRPPRDRTADHGRQLPVGGREAEPGAGIRQGGRRSMML